MTDQNPKKEDDINTTPYVPQPIDISDVVLDSALLALTERLVEHNHDLWAKRRLKEGWTWGPVRDDSTRQTPCLVAYEHLPKEEKEYDRETAIGVLKAVVALGFRVILVRPDAE